MYTISYFDSSYETTHLFFTSTREIAEKLIWEWIGKTANHTAHTKKYEDLEAESNSIDEDICKLEEVKSNLDYFIRFGVREDWTKMDKAEKAEKIILQDKYSQDLKELRDKSDKCCEELRRMERPSEVVAHYKGYWQYLDTNGEYCDKYTDKRIIVERTDQQMFDLMCSDLYEIKMDKLIDYSYTNGD